jgi:CheY-like chemotaxis protein
VAQDCLESLGYEVLLACDDEEAERMVRQAQERGERIDAAILDLTIPGARGGEAALRQLQSIIPSLPGIASSGYSGAPAMARPVEHGFAAALKKPYTIAELAMVVAQVIRTSRASGEQPPSPDSRGTSVP